jgi:tetratricopeptide (TPR) repeat protein
MKKYLILLILFNSGFFAQAQIIDLPVVNAKSHKTLVIDKIEKNPAQTVFYLSVTNEIESGDAWFCADKQIYLKESKGDRMYFMEQSQGIPNCPESHKFTKVGEILEFKLIFPPLPIDLKEIDMIENCSDNCFYFYGIVMDPATNTEIRLFEKGVAFYSSKNYTSALSCFQKITEKPADIHSNTYAYAMYIIPLIYFQSGDRTNAEKKYRLLQKSDITDKNFFIEKLKQEDFFKNLN